MTLIRRCILGEGWHSAPGQHTHSARTGAPTAGLHNGRRDAPVVQRLSDGEADRCCGGHLRLRREDNNRLPGGGVPDQAGEPAAAAAAGLGVQTRDTAAQGR